MNSDTIKSIRDALRERSKLEREVKKAHEKLSQATNRVNRIENGT